MNSAAHQFIDIKTLAIEKAGQRRSCLARRAKKFIDKEWVGIELLDNQVASGLVGVDFIAPRDHLHQTASGLVVQGLHMDLDTGFRSVIRAMKNVADLAAQTGQRERTARARHR